MTTISNEIRNADQDTFLDINIGSLIKNYKKIKNNVSKTCTVAATVKANAYGLGIIPVAKILITNKCKIFFVATLTEGLELRQVNKKITIYVLNGLNSQNINLFYKHNLIPSINNLNQLKKAETFSLNKGKFLKIALHFDTGMSRLGLDKMETQILLKRKESLIKNTEVTLVMSHLACADNSKNLKNKKQLNQFKIISRHFPNVKLSLSNSAGILLGKKYHFDLVRPGISLYGGNCTLRKRNIYNHVISLKAKIIQTRNINKGETIGYGATYKSKRKMLIATIPVGYADGINRLFSNRIDLYFRNKKVKIIGRVSMDLITVDLTKFTKSRLTENDYVELVNLKNNIDYLSKTIKTIPYEILTSLGKRYQRRYIS
tara:strand:+ start:19 stop:1140 length:1122 start_codon:yes stop_codon:yes gene_type:complete